MSLFDELEKGKHIFPFRSRVSMGRIFYRIPPVKQQKCAAGRLGQLPGLTDSKTLDCQRTNPREYQTVRTHTKETT